MFVKANKIKVFRLFKDRRKKMGTVFAKISWTQEYFLMCILEWLYSFLFSPIPPLFCNNCNINLYAYCTIQNWNSNKYASSFFNLLHNFFYNLGDRFWSEIDRNVLATKFEFMMVVAHKIAHCGEDRKRPRGHHGLGGQKIGGGLVQRGGGNVC